MTRNHSELLTEVTGETLEQLAFVFSFPDEVDPAAISEAAVTGVQVTFSGPQQGKLLLVVSSAVLAELAANMLGLDDGETPPEDQQKDALREAVNVICGNLLPRIGGVEAVFDIQPPAILDSAAVKAHFDECQANAAEWSCAALSLDEGECQVYLRTTETA
jgi:chemotaxis protein CheY-P-specific phosphatase CheC